MSDVRTFTSGSRITVAVDNQEAEDAAAAALAAAATAEQTLARVEQEAGEVVQAINQTLGAYALTVPVGFPYAPPGALVTFPEGFEA